MLKHWREVKAQRPDTILFYRVGDFYEMFYQDAELAARVLEITLTSRGDGVPLAGVPVKAAADYLRQLVAAGHRVAICEQVEDPRLAKGLVRREVVETITPGALLVDGWIPGGRNNWIVAVSAGRRGRGRRGRSQHRGVSPRDHGRGRAGGGAVATESGRGGPAKRRQRFAPGATTPLLTVREPWEFDPDLAREELARRFSLASLDGLGIGPEDAAALGAGGALLRYLVELQPAGLPHLARPTVRRSDGHLWLDEMTRRNLELVEPLRPGIPGATLLETIDATVTPMGCRLLRQWLLSPLRDPAAIEARLDAVDVAVRDSRGRARVREALDGVRDLERLAGRAAAGRAVPRELGALRDSFQRLPDVAEALSALAGFALPGGGGRVSSRKRLRISICSPTSPASSPRHWRIVRRRSWPTAA